MKSKAAKLALAAICLGPWMASAAASEFSFGPYKFLPLAAEGVNPVMSTAVRGKPEAVLTPGLLPKGINTVSWAFAEGECGSETWSGLDANKVAAANVQAFKRAGLNYVLSTGGQAGVFTCATDAGMQAFVARYDSPQLVGLDFDIEGKQTDAQVDSLIKRIVTLKAKRPALRMSFTLATLAASDGSRNSLNKQGERVLNTIQKHGLKDYVINLMVMDYGPANSGNCVVKQGRCDMLDSALQAAENLHTKYGIAYGQIELTPMIGMNDVVENIFTLDDARALGQAARLRGLAGLHYWSLDRDVGCQELAASDRCSSVHGEPLAYGEAFTSKPQ